MTSAPDPAARTEGVLPRGGRDLLPEACRRRRSMTTALLGAFERWGFEPVITPTLEYFDILAQGLAPSERRLCVRFIEPASGDLVALRSDITAQVARLVSSRSDAELPADATLRLAYAGDVVRQSKERGAQTEVHQVGAELIGDPDPHADAELLAVCHDGLEAAGLEAFRFDLSHRGVGQALIDGLELPAEATGQVRAAILRRDADAAARVLADAGADESAARAVPQLCRLYGGPQTLDEAAAVLGDVVQPGLDELRTVLEALRDLAPRAYERVVVDLGELRGFDYYSGIRMRVWAPGLASPIVRGGRYDALLGRYGAPRAATGFAVDLDAFERAVPGTGTPARTAATIVAIEPQAMGSAARRLAAKTAADARSQGRRAWVQPAMTIDRAQLLARGTGADRVVMITGSPQAPQTTAAAAAQAQTKEEER